MCDGRLRRSSRNGRPNYCSTPLNGGSEAMILFHYDKTFEGLLSCIFFAYAQKCIPDMILSPSDQQPLFADEQYVVESDKVKASRVWSSLEKKLSKIA